MVGCHQRIFDAKSTSLAQLRQPGGYRLEPASEELARSTPEPGQESALLR